MRKPIIKPGETIPVSGQYAVVGPRGGISGKEITGVRGKTAPPTPTPGSKFKLVDKTRH